MLVSTYPGRPIQTYSLFGEDLMIAHMFPANHKGYYVDIGCYEPVNYSNTYWFYQRGWRGLCIDPNPKFAPMYAATRPQDVFVQAGVAPTPGALTYYSFAGDDTVNTFDKEFADKMVAMNNGKISYTTSQVPVENINTIITKAELPGVDLLSIDVEGADFTVLQSFDFNRWRPRVVAIEDHTLDLHNPMFSQTFSFMEQLGYMLIAKAMFTSIYLWPLEMVPHEKEKLELMRANRARLLAQMGQASSAMPARADAAPQAPPRSFF